MAVEIIEILVEPRLPVCEPGAHFFSVLAYPDKAELKQREEFRAALIRWFLLVQSTKDRDRRYIVRASLLTMTEKQQSRSIDRSLNRILRYFEATYSVAMPKILSIAEGKPHKVDGFVPTVNNMIAVMTHEMGWSPESASTAITKIWKPAKRVLHVILATALVQQEEALKARVPSLFYKQCGFEIERFLLRPELIQRVIERAEIWRTTILPETDLRLTESETNIFKFRFDGIAADIPFV